MAIEVDKIGFDFDGVIADTGEAFLRVVCEKYGFCSHSLEQITTFEVERCLDIPKEIVQEVFELILYDSLDTGVMPMPLAQEVISEMSEYGQVNVITARPVVEPVVRWFEKYFPGDVIKKVSILGTGDPDIKGRFIKELGLTHFVDDRAMTCEHLASIDIKALVYQQPWNIDQHELQVVNNWAEIKTLLALGD